MNFIEKHGLNIAMAFVISCVLFLLADLLSSTSIQTTAVVVDKVYKPERNYVTMNSTSDGKGHVRFYPVFHHDPPEWKFIVQDNSANIVNVWCSQSEYIVTKLGTQIPIVTRYGGWTGWRYGSETLRY